ncbi:MAG: D-alanyl-D-alanine carboxypeptidase family protein [Vulcanibacillus sp.]
MKTNQRFIISFLILTLIISTIGINPVLAQKDLEVNAITAILVDGNSGKILYGKNIDKPLPPASMTKMMVEYIVLEYINAGELNWNDIVTASEYASWLGATGGSAVYLAEGEKNTVKDLFDAMAVASANDATVALAEHIANTETDFVKLMNEKSQELGMEHTYFLTSTGYPAEELGDYAPIINGEHVMSAKDAAILAWHLINDYPESLKINGQPSIEFRPGNTFKSWNFMLPGLVFEYEGVDGLKTGHTSQAGYCFTATAKRDDIRLISVVFGTDSEISRFNETKKIFDYGFSNYEVINIVNAKDTIVGFEEIPIEKGVKTEISIAAKNDLKVLIENGEKDLYTPKIIINDSITAPIEADENVGYISYNYLGDKEYEYINDYIKLSESKELITTESVDKASWFRLFFRKVFNVTGNVFSTIIDGVKNIF